MVHILSGNSLYISIVSYLLYLSIMLSNLSNLLYHVYVMYVMCMMYVMYVMCVVPREIVPSIVCLSNALSLGRCVGLSVVRSVCRCPVRRRAKPGSNGG
jgi:hypothetical protein